MNRKTEADVTDREAFRQIRQLVDWLGELRIRRGLETYDASLKLADGPMYRDYYLKVRHPWWEPLNEFMKLKRKGVERVPHTSPRLTMLAADANKIVRLKRTMPRDVQDSFSRNLLADDPIGHLFELEVAWQYYLKGFDLSWYSSKNSTIPEFSATRDSLTLNVECKTIAADTGRRIKRRTFYQLADRLIPQLEKDGLNGRVELLLKDDLPNSPVELTALSAAIQDAVLRGDHGAISPWGAVTYEAIPFGKTVYTAAELEELRDQYIETLPIQAGALFWAPVLSDGFVPPLLFVCVSETEDAFAAKIRDKMKQAYEQLPQSSPGVIAIHIPEIHSFRGLESKHKLKRFTDEFFERENWQHIAEVLFLSDFHGESTWYRHHRTAAVLEFVNPNCVYEVPFNYLEIEEEPMRATV